MKKKYKPAAIALFLLSFYVLVPSYSGAGAPTDQIRDSVDKVQAVLKNPQLKSATRTKERRDQLRQIISARFDFSEKTITQNSSDKNN